MTGDKDLSYMGMCPRCLASNFDGVCDKCGYIERTERDPYDDDDYNYLKHAESD